MKVSKNIGNYVTCLPVIAGALIHFSGGKSLIYSAKSIAVFRFMVVYGGRILTSPAFMDSNLQKPIFDPEYLGQIGEKEGTFCRAFEIWKPLCEEYHCSFATLVEAWALSQYDRIGLLVGMKSSVEDL